MSRGATPPRLVANYGARGNNEHLNFVIIRLTTFYFITGVDAGVGFNRLDYKVAAWMSWILVANKPLLDCGTSRRFETYAKSGRSL